MSSYFVISTKSTEARVDDAGTQVCLVSGTDLPYTAWPSAWWALLWPGAWIEAASLALLLKISGTLVSHYALAGVVLGWLYFSVYLRVVGKRVAYDDHLDTCQQSYHLLLSTQTNLDAVSTETLRRALFARHNGQVAWHYQLTREMLLRLWTSVSVVEAWQSRAETRGNYLQIGHLNTQIANLPHGTCVGPYDVLVSRYERAIILALSSECVRTAAHWEIAQAMLGFAWTTMESFVEPKNPFAFVPLPNTYEAWSELDRELRALRLSISKETWRRVLGDVEWLRD